MSWYKWQVGVQDHGDRYHEARFVGFGNLHVCVPKGARLDVWGLTGTYNKYGSCGLDSTIETALALCSGSPSRSPPVATSASISIYYDVLHLVQLCW